jgi:hypothetical protein
MYKIKLRNIKNKLSHIDNIDELFYRKFVYTNVSWHFKLKFMKQIITFICLLIFTLNSYSQKELQIWIEFLDLVKKKQMTVDKIQPYDQIGDTFRPILLSFLDSLRTFATSDDWESIPEIIKTNNRIQYIVPWTSRGGTKADFCFTFVITGSQWYFQHLESIFIRLDKTPNLPVSKFPDISETQKAWAREEIYWSFIIQNIYLPISKEKSKASTLDLLKDGNGYLLNAKTWVPLVSPQKAFILYLCWEQANLRGNDVILESLSDTSAIVYLKPQFISLYYATGHLKTMISENDYKQIYETIWVDRAKSAGWILDIEYSNDNSVKFKFIRNKQ